ncbi:MAG: hypothetical protein JXA92_05760 [candidate division Zixibacteria bacterium]|nr:hypothetical protein [candidate division Zixibacteria bacterium]
MRKNIFFATVFVLWGAVIGYVKPPPEVPSFFDLRDVEGENYVTSVKSQQGGTCWVHGTMAAMESNLMMTGNWAVHETGEANLSEYHLDWWNGFNKYCNHDVISPKAWGVEVHMGGDYRIAAAYLTRGTGSVRDFEGSTYSEPRFEYYPSYHYYYPREIEWFSIGENLENINTVKDIIMLHGAIGTCIKAYGFGGFLHYQPDTSTVDPDHAVAIVGWDDAKYITGAPWLGAWLCKNSWGADWGNDGYFWVSYYDKHCGKHPEMGAVSFQGVERMRYKRVYFHDYHGWRGTRSDVDEACNAFKAVGNEFLQAVSFYTAIDSVDFTVILYSRFEDNEFQDELASVSGFIDHIGFHTVDLEYPVKLKTEQDFYVYLYLSRGGHPIDCTSEVKLLLGAKADAIVPSKAAPGQSYYRSGDTWYDLYEWDDTLATSSNFCIKALGSEVAFEMEYIFPDGLPDFVPPGQAVSFPVVMENGTKNIYPETAALCYRYTGGDFIQLPLTALEGDTFEVVLPVASCPAEPTFYLSVELEGGKKALYPYRGNYYPYRVGVGIPTVLFEDDFETDRGWTVENLGATDGLWERGVPVNDPAQVCDPACDACGSGQCYLTANRTGSADVDSGAVRLISPVFDMSNGGLVSYDYYLAFNDTAGEDIMLVEINDTGGDGDWTEIARHDTDSRLRWRHQRFTAEEITSAGVSLTSQMRLRFTVNDTGTQNIVEAGLDNFTVLYTVCDIFVCAGTRGNADCSADEEPDISDITRLIDFLYLTHDPLCCEEEADVNGSGGEPDISDITRLIDYLYLSHAPLPSCP